MNIRVALESERKKQTELALKRDKVKVLDPLVIDHTTALNKLQKKSFNQESKTYFKAFADLLDNFHKKGFSNNFIKTDKKDLPKGVNSNLVKLAKGFKEKLLNLYSNYKKKTESNMSSVNKKNCDTFAKSLSGSLRKLKTLCEIKWALKERIAHDERELIDFEKKLRLARKRDPDYRGSAGLKEEQERKKHLNHRVEQLTDIRNQLEGQVNIIGAYAHEHKLSPKDVAMMELFTKPENREDERLGAMLHFRGQTVESYLSQTFTASIKPLSSNVRLFSASDKSSGAIIHPATQGANYPIAPKPAVASHSLHAPKATNPSSPVSGAGASESKFRPGK